MLAFIACFIGARADVLVVADGTDTSTDLPIKGSYCDTEGTYGYMIYHADSLTQIAGGEISKLTFHTQTMSSSNAGCVLQLSLKEIADATIPTTSTVYDGLAVCGTYEIVGGEETLAFEFDAPFAYSGDENLLVEVRVITKSSGYSTFNTFGVSQTTGVNTSFTHYGSYSNYLINFVPKVTFEYTNETKQWDAKVSPLNINFGTVYIGNDSTINVNVKNRGLNAFTPTLTREPASPFSVTYEPAQLATDETVEIPVKFAPTAEGLFADSLIVDCGEAGSFKVYINGKAVEMGSEVTVCDGTNLNGYVPLYGSYYDTEGTTSQFIYPKEMLTALNGRAITSVKFFATSSIGIKNGKLQLSVKEVDYTTFERENANAVPTNSVTEMTVVGTIVPAGTETELEFVFDEPYVYKGGNLAFETYVLEKNNYQSISWYGVNQDYECAYYVYESTWGGTSTGLVKFLPKMFVESIAADEPVEHVYSVAGNLLDVFGSDNVWNPENTLTEMEKNDDGIYEWTSGEFEISAGTKIEFKVVEDHSWAVSYGKDGGADNAEVTPEKDGKYKLTVYFEPDNEEVPNNVYGELELIEETFGKVYILGNVDNHDWAPNVGVEMTTTDGKIYTKNVSVRIDDSGSGAPGLKVDETEGNKYGFFSFTTKLSEDAEDWDAIAPYRFGAVSEASEGNPNGDFRIYKNQFGQELSLTKENGHAFEIEEGDYTFTVDMENMTFVVEGQTLTGISDIMFRNAKSVRYYNLQGVESATPFDGVNIVVLEMPDGSKNTVKMIK